MPDHHIIFATVATVGPLLRSTPVAPSGPIWPFLIPIAFGVGMLVGLWLAGRNAGSSPGGGGPWRWPRSRPQPPDPIGGDGEDPPPAWIAEVERYLARQVHPDPGTRH